MYIYYLYYNFKIIIMDFENKLTKFNIYPATRIALAFSIVLLAIGTVSVAPSSQFVMAQGQSYSSAINATKPVDGYNAPQGHLSAIRHVFDDPALRYSIIVNQMTK